MKILLTGATGFIGRKLALRLSKEGHELVILTRNAKRASLQLGSLCQAVSCDLMQGPPPLTAFTGIDAVIHLAGETIAGRWTKDQKKKIHDSRVIGTQNLVKAFKAPGIKAPALFIAPSAIGFYGDRGDEVLSEDSTSGRGFLAEVCRDWEAETEKAAGAKTRVAILRLGMVLGPGGGALAQMLMPFSVGLGAKVGSGKQWMSWVHIDNVVDAFSFALKNTQVTGPVNVVAPHPVTNYEFTRTLATVLKKKARLTLPAPLLRLALGEMADLLLSSSRVRPTKLDSLGFTFSYATLFEALTQICSDSGANSSIRATA